MRDETETHKKNKRVRIIKWWSNLKVYCFHIQVCGFITRKVDTGWVSVAVRGNIKEARIVADCFAALVEGAP